MKRLLALLLISFSTSQLTAEPATNPKKQREIAHGVAEKTEATVKRLAIEFAKATENYKKEREKFNKMSEEAATKAASVAEDTTRKIDLLKTDLTNATAAAKQAREEALALQTVALENLHNGSSNPDQRTNEQKQREAALQAAEKAEALVAHLTKKLEKDEAEFKKQREKFNRVAELAAAKAASIAEDTTRREDAFKLKLQNALLAAKQARQEAADLQVSALQELDLGSLTVKNN